MMIKDDPKMLLYIEPEGAPSQDPVVDEATRGMAALLRKAPPPVIRYRGFHQCRCGARSANYDLEIAPGVKTNSLAVHYLAFHRQEVPVRQLLEVLRLARTTPDLVPATPTEDQLQTPKR